MTTITASSTVGIVLTGPAYVNPVVIGSGVIISNTTTNGAGIAGGGGAWTIQNYGSITGGPGSVGGVRLANGGVVANDAANASITGFRNGIYVLGGAATVTNEGTIASTGTPGTGYFNGIFVSGGTGTINNEGTISAASAGTRGLGIQLRNGGVVTNASSASIIGGDFGILNYSGSATVVNSGAIRSVGAGTSSGRAIAFDFGGSVANAASGVIAGSYDGIRVGGAAGTVVNYGSIGGATENGVFLHGGGSVTNGSSGLITGNVVAVGVSAATPGFVLNNGTITSTGPTGEGVDFQSGGSVTNEVTGRITGYLSVVVSGGSGTVLNDGSIAGIGTLGAGVRLRSGGSITNAASASVIGGQNGVHISGGAGTVVNDGDIATYSGATLSDGVVLDSGGTVTNGASGTIAGGTFGVHLPAGGTLANAGSIIGNAGTAAYFGGAGSNLLVLDPGYEFSGLVVGSVSASNTLELASAMSAGTVIGLGTEFINFGPILFDAGSDWFVSGDTGGLAGTISGFAFGDTIEVTGITATGSSYSGGILTLDEAGGSATLALPGSFATGDFVVTNVAGGTDVSLAAPCFVAGTRVRTQRGTVAVEALRVGDCVPVLMGRMPQPIIWLGHRRVDCRRHPDPANVWPICLSAGAFGPGRPFRDLWLSPDHALFINGALIPIRYLVNGRTIRQEERDSVTYWHVELAEHNVLYAEGVPAESYLETGNRGAFANGGPCVDLHPDFAREVWEAKGCAPLVLGGAKLTAAKRGLLERAAVLGYAITGDCDLAVLTNRKRLTTTMDGPTTRVRLAEGTRNIRLVSRVWTPAHMQPGSDDTRLLGVAVSQLWLDGREVDRSDPCLTRGWHAAEPEWRWTNGEAWIATDGARDLSFSVTMTGTYWHDSAGAMLARRA